MKPDVLTKVLLGLITVLLAAIVTRPLTAPAPVEAQSSLAGVQFSGEGGGFWAFDTRSGEVWYYGVMPGKEEIRLMGRLTKLGAPLQVQPAPAK